MATISARALRLATVLLVGVTAVAACGGGSGGGSGSASPSSSRPSSSRPGTGGASSSTPLATESNPPGDIPDNQVFVLYHPHAGAFSVTVPEGWSRKSAGHGVRFTDKFNSVQIEQTRAARAPSVTRARSVEARSLVARYHNFHLTSVTSVHRRSGTGVLVRFDADSPVNPVTGKVVVDDVQRYEFWQAGTLAVLTLSGPKRADNVDPWRTVTDSLRWV